MPNAGQLVKFGFLNIVATPHPEGVYERLLRSGSNSPVKYWGLETAAITGLRARPGEDGLFTGRIMTWVEINPESPAVNKQRLEEVELNEAQINMTSTHGFNSRVFRFVFDANRHLLTFFTLNELGQKLSPRRSLTIFEKVLSPAILGAAAETIDVTVIPEDDALSYVLSIDRLDKVRILIKIPNDDDVTQETHEVLEELREQNAKAQETVLSRAPQTEGLELSDKNNKYARVAAHNGHVEAKGRDSHGEPDTRSTKEYPKIVERLVETGTSFIESLVRTAKEMRAYRAQR